MEIPLRYIAVEGPIGVGKTSLCELLAEDFNLRLLKEESDQNPFLSDFYQNRSKYAFQTQVFFLLSRYQQQRDMVQQELFHQGFVSDYLFAKDKIFAQLNLSPEELSLYDSVYSLLNPKICKPDLVIFLQATTDVLIQRIKKRKTPREKHIDSKYIEALAQAYNDFFFFYDETPLLVVNVSELNFVENRDDYQNLLKEILVMKKKELQKHYVTIRSA
jgi:deoxyguanosine kinase